MAFLRSTQSRSSAPSHQADPRLPRSGAPGHAACRRRPLIASPSGSFPRTCLLPRRFRHLAAEEATLLKPVPPASTAAEGKIWMTKICTEIVFRKVRLFRFSEKFFSTTACLPPSFHGDQRKNNASPPNYKDSNDFLSISKFVEMNFAHAIFSSSSVHFSLSK